MQHSSLYRLIWYSFLRPLFLFVWPLLYCVCYFVCFVLCPFSTVHWGPRWVVATMYRFREGICSGLHPVFGALESQHFWEASETKTCSLCCICMFAIVHCICEPSLGGTMKCVERCLCLWFMTGHKSMAVLVQRCYCYRVSLDVGPKRHACYLRFRAFWQRFSGSSKYVAVRHW